jgi:hypothetical protein
MSFDLNISEYDLTQLNNQALVGSVEQDIRQQLESRIMSNANSLSLLKEYLSNTGYDPAYVNSLTKIGAAECYYFEVTLSDFKYNNLSEVYTPELIAEQTYINDSPVDELIATFEYNKSLTETFSFKFNEGLKIGTSAKFKAGLPIVGEGEVSVSGEISFGAEQAWTKTEARAWKDSRTIKVLPKTGVKVTATVSNAKISSSFVGVARATTGKVFVSVLNSQSNSYNDIVVPLTALLPDSPNREVPLSGTFNGAEAVNSVTRLEPIN